MNDVLKGAREFAKYITAECDNSYPGAARILIKGSKPSFRIAVAMEMGAYFSKEKRIYFCEAIRHVGGKDEQLKIAMAMELGSLLLTDEREKFLQSVKYSP